MVKVTDQGFVGRLERSFRSKLRSFGLQATGIVTCLGQGVEWRRSRGSLDDNFETSCIHKLERLHRRQFTGCGGALELGIALQRAITHENRGTYPNFALGALAGTPPPYYYVSFTMSAAGSRG